MNGHGQVQERVRDERGNNVSTTKLERKRRRRPPLNPHGQTRIVGPEVELLEGAVGGEGAADGALNALRGHGQKVTRTSVSSLGQKRDVRKIEENGRGGAVMRGRRLAVSPMRLYSALRMRKFLWWTQAACDTSEQAIGIVQWE